MKMGMVMDRTLTVDRIENAINKLQHHENDVGSAEIQICLLTAKIMRLTEHTKLNEKDICVKRRLKNYADKRRALLKYLAINHQEIYQNILHLLSLRKLNLATRR